MKILHVMKILPYPANDGFSADIWDRIQSMKRLGHTVHVLITTGSAPISNSSLEKLRSTVDKVDLVERSSLLGSVLSWKPTLISRNNTLSGFPLQDQYDLTLAESEHLAPIFFNPQLRSKIRAIRIHNNENKYMWELAGVESRFGWKLFFALEAVRYGWYLKRGHQNVDTLWFISRDEFERSRRKNPDQRLKSYWLPPSVMLSSPGQDRKPKRGQVLFIGGLKNPLNREGVRWYLREVHPRLLVIPEYELVIAGNASGSPEAYSLAQEAGRQQRTTVHLSPDNLDPLYANCALMINPMRRGSGVKMKTIHAIQRRVPLVTTTVGAEGSGFANGEHIRVADSPDAFATAVAELLAYPRAAAQIADQAFEFLLRHYDSDRNLAHIIHSVLSDRDSVVEPREAALGIAG